MEGKVWIAELRNMHPGKRIVVTNVVWGGQGDNKRYGILHSVHDTSKEARDIKFSLDDSYGTVSILEGDDPGIHLGGMFRDEP